TLQVLAEDDGGVTISGMKMLATGAVFADEVWIGKAREREHHLRATGQHARRLVLGARTLRAARSPRGGLSAELPLRRDRHGAGLRPRQGAVGTRLPAQQRGDVAPHLYRDAGELLPEPAIERALLGQDGTDRRAREPDVPGEWRGQDPGRA